MYMAVRCERVAILCCVPIYCVYIHAAIYPYANIYNLASTHPNRGFNRPKTRQAARSNLATYSVTVQSPNRYTAHEINDLHVYTSTDIIIYVGYTHQLSSTAPRRYRTSQ